LLIKLSIIINLIVIRLLI